MLSVGDLEYPLMPTMWSFAPAGIRAQFGPRLSGLLMYDHCEYSVDDVAVEFFE